jgi:predicted HTH transcriptional regulator
MDMTGWLEYFTEGLGAQMRDVQMTAEHVMRKDVVLVRARRNGLKERPVAILGYLLTESKATVAECEEELKMNRRTLQRDLKLLVEKGLVREVGTGPTDPTKYYQPPLSQAVTANCDSARRASSTPACLSVHSVQQ